MSRSVDRRLLAFYAVLAAIFYAPLLLGSQTLYFDDTQRFYHPMRALVFGQLRAGRLPLWTPLVGAGYPVLAEGQAGALYLGNVFAWLWRSDTLALSWTVWIHGWLAAALTHGYLRGVGVRPGPAALGAVAFMFSGAFVGHLVYLSMALAIVWLPGVCWGLEHAAHTGRWRGYTLAGAALGMAFTAVHVQIACYVLLVGLCYGTVRALASERPIRGLLGVAWAAAFGGLFAAVQLLPMLELVGQSGRGSVDRAFLTEYGLSLSWLLFCFMPHFFGHPTIGPQWANLTVPWELNAYIGIAATVPALLAPLVSRRRVTFALAAIWWGTFLLAWGRHLPLFELLHRLPGLSAFRIPARWLMPGCFAGAALAALTVDALQRDPVASQRLRRAMPFLAVVTAALLALAWLAADTARAAGRIGPAEIRHAALAALWFTALWQASAMLLLAGAGRRWLTSALVALLILDLFVAQRGYNPTAPPSVFDPLAEPLADPVAAHVARALGPNERVWIPAYASACPFLAPNTNVLLGVANLDNFLPLTVHRIDSLLNTWRRDGEPQRTHNGRERWLVAVRQGMAGLDHQAAAARIESLRRLRVRYVLPRYGPVGARGNADGLYRIDGPLGPLAWLASTGEPLPYRAESGAREQVGPGPGGVWAVNGVAYPGWKAYDSSGRRLPTGACDGLFRAVNVPGPSTDVRSVFQPTTFRVGLFLTLAALAGLAAVGWWR